MTTSIPPGDRLSSLVKRQAPASQLQSFRGAAASPSDAWARVISQFPEQSNLPSHPLSQGFPGQRPTADPARMQASFQRASGGSLFPDFQGTSFAGRSHALGPAGRQALGADSIGRNPNMVYETPVWDQRTQSYVTQGGWVDPTSFPTSTTPGPLVGMMRGASAGAGFGQGIFDRLPQPVDERTQLLEFLQQLVAAQRA